MKRLAAAAGLLLLGAGLVAGCVSVSQSGSLRYTAGGTQPLPNGVIINRAEAADVDIFVFRGHWPLEGPAGLVEVRARNVVTIKHREALAYRASLGSSIVNFGGGPAEFWLYLTPYQQFTILYHVYRPGLLCSTSFGFGVAHITPNPRQPVRYCPTGERCYYAAWVAETNGPGQLPGFQDCLPVRIDFDLRILNPYR